MSIAISYRLLLVQPRVVFAAQVNQQIILPDTAQVTYDNVTSGSYTDIRSEMMALFGTFPGGDDLGRARVRKPPTSNTLYIGWSSRGKGEGEVYIQDDAYITVIDLYKPWTKNPRIDDNGVQYLDYDKDFASHQYSPPIVNLDCGPAIQRDLDPEIGLATFEFNAIHTYMTDPDAAAMYTAWAWELPDEATVIDGALDSHYIAFTLPQGAWWISAYETASTGSVGVRRVLCVAGEPPGTLKHFDQIEIIRTVEGQTLRVRVSEPIPKSTYPNGCMAVLWKKQTEDGMRVIPPGLPGHEHVAFTGWHYSDELDGRATEQGYIEDTVLEFRDIGTWLQTQPGYPITIMRDENPASWYEIKRANIDYAIARLVLEYSNAAALTDFDWSWLGYDHYPFPSLASQGTTLYEMIDYFARAIAHRLTCDQWGRLHIKPDPQLLDDEGGATPIARTSVIQASFSDEDISELRITETPFPRQNWNWGEAVVAKAMDADAQPQIDVVFAVAPGRAPSQGTATAQTSEQLVKSQAELNARLGHAYARANSTTAGVEIVPVSPDDRAIQPAYLQWIALTTSAATAGQRGHIYTAQRLLPHTITISHDAERQTQIVRIQTEREIYGAPADTYYPPQTDIGNIPEWEPPVTEEPPPSWYLGATDNLLLIHESGEISITSTFTRSSLSGGPEWTVVNLSLDGMVLDAVTDPFSPRYLGTGTVVNAWIVTTKHIYRVADIANAADSRTVTQQFTFVEESEYRSIQTERGVKNFVLVSSYYEGGIKVARTIDGANWTESGTVGGAFPGAVVFEGEYDWYYEYDFSTGLAGWTLTTGEHDPVGGYVQTVYVGLGFMLDLVSPPFDNTSIIRAVYLDIEITPGIDSWNTSPTLRDSHPLGGNIVTGSTLGFEPPVYGRFHKVVEGLSYTLEEGNGVRFIADFRRFTSPYGSVRLRKVQIAGTGTPPWNDGPSIDPGAYAGDPTPTVHVSGKVPGQAYVGVVAGSIGRLYRTLNYGTGWGASTLAHTFEESLGMALHVPWHDNANDLNVYWGYYYYSNGSYGAARTDAPGAQFVDITPAPGYGPVGPKAWSTAPDNRQRVALVAGNGVSTGVYWSENGGGLWTEVMAPVLNALSYRGVHVVDSEGRMYLYGPAGIAWTAAGGQAIDDRTTNASASPVVTIGGW